MIKTKNHKDIAKGNRLTVTTETLAEYLDCGRATAVKIGDSAGARVQIGRRVLWNIEVIQNYLVDLSSNPK